jgi:hypothetical protein
MRSISKKVSVPLPAVDGVVSGSIRRASPFEPDRRGTMYGCVAPQSASPKAVSTLREAAFVLASALVLDAVSAKQSVISMALAVRLVPVLEA